MKRYLAALLLFPLIALALACSGDDSSGGTNTAAPSLGQPQKQPSPVQTLDPTLTEAKDNVIEITVQNTAYAPNHLKVAAGEVVTIRVTNKDSQQHNLRLAGFDGQYGTDDDAVTSPEAINPGSSGELTFAPPVPGAYTFRCDFHPGQMGGQIVVQ